MVTVGRDFVKEFAEPGKRPWDPKFFLDNSLMGSVILSNS